MIKLLTSLLTSCVFALLVSHAQAQTVTANVANDVQVALSLERITVDAGKEVLVATERAAPGEQVQYVAVYTNTAAKSAAPIPNLQATMPIPSAMHFTGSAQPTPSQASTDGKAFEAYPIVRIIKQADGTLKRVEVPFNSYRSLRWTLKALAPQASQTVKARMVVINTPAVPESLAK